MSGHFLLMQIQIWFRNEIRDSNSDLDCQDLGPAQDTTKDLAPKANVLRCCHRHCHTPQRGGWHVSGGWYFPWGVVAYSWGGLTLFLAWLMASRGGGIHGGG